ncbi:posphoenolpyruvate synthetase regulatory kinase/phosphorylase PpsR [Solimonas flava]|uniref:posphoenolpyruvate synthetase regulatory kinase/phosphorylase PpsR n=1 Tax=Solimonas flava TaxID=415849 RepID=UPI0004150EE0|nr:pyruvate, water dikinase regulatory protein [Solimonas flava]
MTQRTVFFVSDGTGITAETLGNTLLTQFDGLGVEKTTLPFINSVERARSIVDYINFVATQSGVRPLVFSTTVNDEVREILRSVNGLFLDLFDHFIHLLEAEIGLASSHATGRAHGGANTARYTARIAAMNYSMEHDDGASTRDLGRADVILIAPSRCGKTPTSLYLALQQGLFAANFPLTEDDLEHLRLPNALQGLESRCFGLIIDAERLMQIRNERRPGSRYASLAQCSYELRQAQQLYARYNIPYVDSTNMSVEEIAATVMQEKQLRR